MLAGLHAFLGISFALMSIFIEMKQKSPQTVTIEFCLRRDKMRVALAALLIATAAPVLAQPNIEIGYDRGSLGYEALISNQNDLALDQLTKSRKVPNSDPAKLINLGRAYQRAGDLYLAEQSFMAALNCKDEMDLVLSDGREMSSRKAARLALKQMKATKTQ